jgi:hypothetical protein
MVSVTHYEPKKFDMWKLYLVFFREQEKEVIRRPKHDRISKLTDAQRHTLFLDMVREAEAVDDRDVFDSAFRKVVSSKMGVQGNLIKNYNYIPTKPLIVLI